MDLARMERVMQRVRGGKLPQSPVHSGGWDHLEEMLGAAVERSGVYERLRTGCTGACRVFVTGLWNRTHQQHQRLQSEYFARVGNTRPIGEPNTPQEGVLSAMRRAMQLEQAAAETARLSAADTRDETLRSLYLQLAAEGNDHARQLRCWIHRGVGR